MQVQELMNMPPFANFTIIAGAEGLGRKVSTVSVMDAPDIYNWLNGGEFLLTTGYIMKEDPIQIKELIIEIERAGAAALGIKLGRFIHELPEEVIQIAESLSFPIISVPFTFAFTDIIDPVLSQIINEQSKRLQFSQRIHESFTKLVIDGGGIEKIVQTLGSILGLQVSYYDTYFEEIYMSDQCPERHHSLKKTNIDDIVCESNYFPVKIGNTCYGYILLNEDAQQQDSCEYNQIAIEHASTVIKLNVQRKISNIQIESKYRDEFVQDLILNNITSSEEIQSRSRLYGWNFEGDSVVIVVDIDNFKEKYLKMNTEMDNFTLVETRDRIFLDARKEVNRFFIEPKPIYTTFSDSIVFILQPTFPHYGDFKENINKLGKQLRESIIKKYKYTVTVGIGQLKDSPNEIFISYAQAENAVKLSRMLYKQNQTSFYDDLGIFKLFENASPEIMKEYWMSYLGKLIEHDELTTSQLVPTLDTLATNDWNLKATSKEMYVHYNTVKYRYQKICEILGKDFKEAEDKLNITIALKLLKISEQ